MMSCVLLAGLTASCAYPTTKLDQQFGNATRSMLHQQIVDPEAGSKQSNVTAMDGRSAKEVITNYYESYNNPPMNVNGQTFRVGNGQ